jgi:threonine/homoserine/homoserine lactone efflux protein
MTIALTAIFCTSFLLALSGAMMPGPLLTVTISESSRRGFMVGPTMILCHGVLELALVLALLAGLAPVLQRDEVFIVISLLGGSVLMWMGLGMLRGLSRLSLQGQVDQAGGRNLVLAGIALSAANPYWLLWWASIGLGYIAHAIKFGIVGVAAFFCGHILADLAWYSLISAGIAKGKKFFGDGVYRTLIGGCALFLLAFSCWFLYGGIERALQFS